MKILRPGDGITMNRSRLLADAKARCLEMAKDYSPPRPQTVHLPGALLKRIIDGKADALARKGKITGHDVVVSRALSTVLCGGNTNMIRSLSEQQLLDLERAAFMELVKTEATFKRIDHMVEYGKPFREPIAQKRCQEPFRPDLEPEPEKNRKRCQEPLRAETACGGSASTGKSELALRGK